VRNRPTYDVLNGFRPRSCRHSLRDIAVIGACHGRGGPGLNVVSSKPVVRSSPREECLTLVLSKSAEDVRDMLCESGTTMLFFLRNCRGR